MPDLPEPPASDEIDEPTGTQAELRPLNAPSPGRLVSRSGFSILGPDYHSPNDETVKLHLYVLNGATSSYVGERLLFLQPNVVPFSTDWNVEMPAWVPTRAYACFHYQFKQKNGTESYWYDSGWFEVATPPLITSHVSNQTQDVVRPTLSGTGAAGGFVQVSRTGLGGAEQLSAVGSVRSNGTWDLPLTKDLPDGSNPIYVKMWFDAASPTNSISTNFVYNLLANAIISPLPGNGFINRPRPEISGTGIAGSQVDIHKTGDGTTVYGTANVQTNNTWTVTLARDLPQGSFQLTAKQRKDGKTRTWATAVSGFGLYPLTITAPASPQETAFTLSGTGGVAGAEVFVYQDRSDTLYGRATVSADGRWSVSMTGLPPGALGLTALQTYSGYTAERSSPVMLNIRPPVLTTPLTTVLPDNKVKVSGSGHTGATVEFTYVSGPGAQTLPATPVVNGAWEVTATGWPPGSYTFSVTQKVSDGAGGWIISQPRQFAFTWAVASPSDVTYTVTDYTPTFSGRGTTGATVWVRKSGGPIAAPDATVVNNQWSSQSEAPWGPTLEQVVHLKQILNGQQSEGWVEIKVTIAPLAPVITSLVENGLSPTVTGTCWPGAVVSLVFSDRPTVVHSPSGATGTWTFRRPTDFASGVTHTVTVTQTAASQTSPSVQRTFTVARTLLKPVITEPQENAEAGRELTVRGSSGVAGASMQLRDAQFGRPLGSPKVLTRDGDWEISLTGLEFRLYQIDAQQSLDGRDSERSLERNFHVVVLPPQILVPVSGGDLPRVGTVSGTGMPGALVEVFLQGRPQPLLGPLPVRVDGSWDGVVTLDVGHETLFARQTFEDKTSRDSPFQSFRVVPAAPSIETPALNEFVGRHAVVSGFGYPGDSVTVALAQAPQQVLGRGTVLDDRTWSVTVELDAPSGQRELIVVQWQGEFDSGRSLRAVHMGTYLPVIDRPAPGQRVVNPIELAGTGKPGVMSVVSWFNPDTRWLADVRVPAAQWEGTASQSLPGGGSWVRLQQTISESTPATTSDWTESERFEVLAARPPLP